MSGCQTCDRTPVFKVGARASTTYSMIPEGSKHSGLLVSAVEEGENYYVIQLGQARLGVPRKVRARGGYVDLLAWVGQEIEVCCYDGKVSARLMPLDEQQMRIWELEELIASHLKAEGLKIPAKDAAEALGTTFYDFFTRTTPPENFFKHSAVKRDRLKALSAVVAQ
jgi:hypothetical protein